MTSGASRKLATGAVVAALGLGSGAAQTASAADSCSNAAVRAQQGTPNLPECRAYELVNPSSVDVGEVNRMPYMSNDGEQVSYMSVVPPDDALGAASVSLAVARRGADGIWRSTDSNLKARSGIYLNTLVTGIEAFSPDFTKALLSTGVPGSPDDMDNTADGYVLNVGTGEGAFITPGVTGALPQFIGATPNFDNVVVYMPAGGSLPQGLYYGRQGTPLELLSRFPDGTPAPAELAGGAYQRGLGVGDGRYNDPWVERNGNHAVSDDLRRVYFQRFNGAVNELYLRDRTGSTDVTIPVGASQRTADLGTMYSARFISATHDGSVAYFVSDAQLTDDASATGGIYRFEAATSKLTQLTPDAGPSGLGIAGAIASDDQSHLYFTSTAALEGAAVAGNTNAYVWTKDDGVRYLAAVGPGDVFARVTPDGHYALLRSTASIGGAQNNGHAAIYEYDAQSGEFACASCRPDGSPSTGDANLDAQSFGLPSGGQTHPRNLTFDGRVFFATKDMAVPADTTPAADVYEYNHGKLSLLTSGRDDVDAYLAENSDDGRNVFFVTRTPLVKADDDAGEYDLYDARTDGGVLEPPPPSDPCRGDDCQGPPPSSPAIPSPVTTHVGSNGNAGPQLTKKRLTISKLTASQRRTLARTGKVTLKARVAGSGKLTVRGRGSIAGKTTTVGRGSTTVLKKAATTAKVTFKLTSAARKQLSRRHRLTVRLEFRLSGISKAAKATANLTRGRR
jgi:hypothetical protein